MDQLPIDTSHPAVREYIALVRLQVLTPLSLLLNIATIATCAFVANPSLSKISKLYPTSLTPNAAALGAYVAAIFLSQLGYCMLLILTKRGETKSAYVKAVGLFLPAANLLMALWAISWVMRWFLVSTILQGLILLLLLLSNIALFAYHPPENASVMSLAFVHTPMRFFFMLSFTILFALSLFITLDLTYTPDGPGEPPRDYRAWHALAGLGVLLGTNLASLIIIMARTDLVWCVAATWIAVSVWTAQPKPTSVYITALTFTIIHPLAYLTSLLWRRCTGRTSQPHPIILPGDDDAHPGLYGSRSRASGMNGGVRSSSASGVNTVNGAGTYGAGVGAGQVGEMQRGPTELDDENWG